MITRRQIAELKRLQEEEVAKARFHADLLRQAARLTRELAEDFRAIAQASLTREPKHATSRHAGQARPKKLPRRPSNLEKK